MFRPEKKVVEKKVWEKSIGSLGSNKKGLGILVKKPAAKNNHDFKKPNVAAARPAASQPTQQKNAGTSAATPTAVAGGLGLLGAYSDSGSNSE